MKRIPSCSLRHRMIQQLLGTNFHHPSCRAPELAMNVNRVGRWSKNRVTTWEICVTMALGGTAVNLTKSVSCQASKTHHHGGCNRMTSHHAHGTPVPSYQVSKSCLYSSAIQQSRITDAHFTSRHCFKTASRELAREMEQPTFFFSIAEA